MSWDPAAVPGNSNDYSVCTTWGLIGKNIDLLHVHRARHGFPDLQRAALQLRQTWTPNLIVIENSHTGIALRQYLISQGFREVRGYTPKGTKEERMATFTPVLERGEVRLPRAAPWLGPFLEECGQFPNGKYDDQVDSLSQALFAVKAVPVRDPACQPIPEVIVALLRGRWLDFAPGESVCMRKIAIRNGAKNPEAETISASGVTGLECGRSRGH